MDFITPILGEYGLAGAVIFALGLAVWHERKERIRQTDGRIADRDAVIKAALEAQSENTRALEQVTEAVKALAQEVRFGGGK